ncbi:AMP-binding protein [Micromonospora olivasterospora]|uniref:Acyl-CoA synthetase (AMP-forming)/AMP-acid ligase II n=1 Tax=Micromonospora olivasterospora TaxID=1880 RepID=A0A562IJ87_MICOL|nr:AMP-binding protein [Micromonospora olivasterospora]TWH70948.1 acyl-CoA synthetase (AMP-forming)/AMP-acid ligase II [Micromonospora olivasterospora]
MRAAVPVSDTADAHHPALVDSAGCLSYGELADRVAALAAGLPSAQAGRRLVHVPLAPHRDLVLGYLAVLSAGHVALITPPEHQSITTVYQPDLWLHPDGTFETATSNRDSDEPRHLLHPDLALLLSTSGSTGSPKLVRLSHSNVLSNAEAIGAALSITEADRAVTSLPLHYCFGLSVLHAQLRAGATTVLRPGSVTDPGFADDLRRDRVTVVAATPHVVDLLDVQGVLDQLPSLRLLAQAGGALPPARVRELAARGRAAGWGLAVMYGQTEATARMAVLPPELSELYPDAVGWPIARSAFRLDPAGVDEAVGDGPVGELVFTGPGVMLGYAEQPDDLALGRMHTELRTGDLARIDGDGLVRIVGRRSDFVKIMGIRIDLGQVERSLRGWGLRSCVTGRDDQLQVTYRRGGHSPDHVRDEAAQVSGLSRSVISVRAVDDLPLLPNGKVDRRRSADLHVTGTPGQKAETAAAVVAVLEPLVGPGGIDLDRSFVELGGDSFSHVVASVGLTRLLGDLPCDWHHRPVRDLVALADRPPRSRWRRLLVRRVETTVVLRGAAVVTICGSHVGLFRLAGGAHILLAVAGFLFARYVLASPTTAERVRRTARIAAGVVVPAVAVAAVMLFGFGTGHWSNVALVHWLARPQVGNNFWFVEAYLVIMVATVAVLAVPWLRAAYAADAWRTAMVAVAVLLVPRYLVLALYDGPLRGLPGTVAWLFMAGAAMAAADSRRRRLITTAVAAGAAFGFFPGEAARNLTIMVGLTLLALVPALPVPRLLVRPLGALAAASLHIYLVQFQVFTFFGSPTIKFAAAIAAGLGFCAVGNYVLRRRLSPLPAVAVIRRRVAAKPFVREDMTCVDARS